MYTYTNATEPTDLPHSDTIPEDEVWVKVGGDKGGGIFKMFFQIGNTSNPNSPENTSLFALYEAHDSASNLRICLEQYGDQIADISTSTWRLV